MFPGDYMLLGDYMLPGDYALPGDYMFSRGTRNVLLRLSDPVTEDAKSVTGAGAAVQYVFNPE